MNTVGLILMQLAASLVVRGLDAKRDDAQARKKLMDEVDAEYEKVRLAYVRLKTGGKDG